MVSYEAGSERAQLAAEAYGVATALGGLVDLARTLGESPEGYDLDELGKLEKTLGDWAIGLAVAADDRQLLRRFTARPRRRFDPPRPDAANLEDPVVVANREIAAAQRAVATGVTAAARAKAEGRAGRRVEEGVQAQLAARRRRLQAGEA